MASNARQQHLRLVADDRLNAAAELFSGKHYQLAAYVNHVGVECLLKARILRQANVTTVASLRQHWTAAAVDALFASKSGHNLQLLAEKATLRRVLTANGTEHLLQQPAWQRLCAEARPYSLRYGQEPLTRANAELELKWAKSLRDTLWLSI